MKCICAATENIVLYQKTLNYIDNKRTNKLTKILE